MEYFITELSMFFMSVVAGLGITIYFKCIRKIQSNLFLTIILYSYFEFWFLSAFRVLLLKGTSICSYFQDVYLLLIDIVLLTIIAYLVIISNLFAKLFQIRHFEKIGCSILFAYYVIQFLTDYIRYNSIRASIYFMHIPYRVFISGVLILLPYLIYILYLSKTSDIVESVPQNAGIAVTILFVVTCFLHPISETYMTNADEFSFNLKQISPLVFLCLILIAVVGIIIYAFCRVSTRISRFICAFSICTYIQSMFMNQKIFEMDGSIPIYEDTLKLFNLLTWYTIFLCLYCILNKYTKILVFISMLLSFVQIIGGLSLVPHYIEGVKQKSDQKAYLSDIGLYELANKENIIIFVLDKYDVSFMNEVLNDTPDFLSPLKGFTYFPDTVAQFSRTFPAIPYMLTGEEYYYETAKNDYINNAYTHCPFWQELQDKEYNIYLYTDASYIGNSVLQVTQNYVPEGHIIEENYSLLGCIESILKINGYRLMPYALKQYYTYTSSEIDNAVISLQKLDYPIYQTDNDSVIYENLRNYGLKISEDEKAFRFIHLNGAHPPYTMNENGKNLTNRFEQVDAIAQYKGCMNLVYDYLYQLETLGLYNESTIIITADHGNYIDKPLLEECTNPILFVKPRNAGYDALHISDTYASQNDLLPTISAIADMNYEVYNGLDVMNTRSEDKTRIRYHNYAIFEHSTQTKTLSYEIKGSSLDFSNWYNSGKYHELGKYKN